MPERGESEVSTSKASAPFVNRTASQITGTVQCIASFGNGGQALVGVFWYGCIQSEFATAIGARFAY
jgi:hypothetical protein